MAVIYSVAAINARLQAVIDTIDANGPGSLVLLDAGGTALSTITLPVPSGTVSGGVLTFTGPLADPLTTGTGDATAGVIKDGLSAPIVSGLTVGVPLSGADILLSNGLSTTYIAAGQTLVVPSAQITGS